MSNFVDIIGDIVTHVRHEYDTDMAEPYYMYGHPLEIFNILAEMDQNETFKYSKYPLIALFQDFEEQNTKNTTTVNNVTIVIMVDTSTTFIAPTRYETTFTPILQPIYELFIKHLKRSIYVTSEDYEHKKIDRLYWGKEDAFGNSGNIGNDALDAIVISGLNLRLIENCKDVPDYRITEDSIYRITEDNKLRTIEN